MNKRGEDMAFQYILAIIVGFIVLGLFIAMIFMKRKSNYPTDYYALFIIGISWIGVGTVMMTTLKNPAFLGMGIAFMAIGLANKSKWETNRRRFKDLDPIEKKLKMVIIGLLSLMVLIGIVTYLMIR